MSHWNVAGAQSRRVTNWCKLNKVGKAAFSLDQGDLSSAASVNISLLDVQHDKGSVLGLVDAGKDFHDFMLAISPSLLCFGTSATLLGFEGNTRR